MKQHIILWVPTCLCRSLC